MMAAFRLAAIWDDLPRAIATITAAPADATGLTDRGRICEGLRADLVRIEATTGFLCIRGVWSRGRQVG